MQILYHYITVPGHPSDPSYVMNVFKLGVPLHYSSGASIRLYVYWVSFFFIKYHYITVPGHPSDSNPITGERYLGCTITLQFRGIHPTDFTDTLIDTCTITLQFRGIHPTKEKMMNTELVPLHYSSGASIRQC